MIFLIGTNHELQHNAKPFRIDEDKALKAREEFKEYISNLCGNKNLELIAEELCEELLELKNTTSILKDISIQNHLNHIFCDPNLKERAEIGLPSHGTEDSPDEEKLKYHKIREAFWLEKLNDILDKTILFVCGAEHVSTFKNLLESKDLEVKILNEYWGKDYYET